MSFAQIRSGRNFLRQDKNVFCSNHVWEKFPSPGQKYLLLKSCVGERAAWELLVWAAVQKDPFIPIRRVRCPTQRNPVELNTIYTTLSSPPPWDINLRNHQEQAFNMPSIKILVKYRRCENFQLPLEMKCWRKQDNRADGVVIDASVDQDLPNTSLLLLDSPVGIGIWHL